MLNKMIYKTKKLSILLIREEASFFIISLTILLFSYGADELLSMAITPGTINLFICSILGIWLLGTILWAAFNVVRHAEALALKLGEPLGTIILTLSVVGIEVALISAVMLTGEAAPTMARDTMMAILMIVLGGLTGASILIGGYIHGEQDYSLPGARTFLGVLLPLAVFALILPKFTLSTEFATFSSYQAAFFAFTTFALYVIFLRIQTNRHKSYFEQPKKERTADHEAANERAHYHGKLHSTYYHIAFLILTLVPIVLLSKRIAKIIDFGIVEVGAPVALGGIIIAFIVLIPESMAALSSARANQLQRSINLLLGSALSTIGLTLPAVLAVSLVTEQSLILGLDMAPMVLLLLTLVVCIMTFNSARTNIMQGAVHLVLFLAYLLLILNP